MRFFRYLLFLFVLSIGKIVFSQTQARTQPIHYQCHYSIVSVQSESDLQTLEAYISNMPTIMQVKYKYKPDSQMAEFVFTYYEEENIAENRSEVFSLTDIKKRMILLGMSPGDITIEKLSNR